MNHRLFLNEKGRTIHARNEGISKWSWARKIINVDVKPDSACLFLYLGRIPINEIPLQVEVNAHPFEVKPELGRLAGMSWVELDLPPGVLSPGENEIILKTESDAMDSWLLGLDPSASAGTSSKSPDQGKRWIAGHLGWDYSLPGEYIIRLWVETQDHVEPPRIPRFQWENMNHPKLTYLRESSGIEKIVKGKDTIARAKSLSGRISRGWRVGTGTTYCPWEVFTLHSWAKANKGNLGEPANHMCVHYSVEFAHYALALGMQTRCWAIAPSGLLKGDGHFVSEVWIPEMKKWVLFDPRLDAMGYRDDIPPGATEISDLCNAGRGAEIDWRLNDPDREDIDVFYHIVRSRLRMPVSYFRRMGLLNYNTFFSSPEKMMVEHGMGGYRQIDFVWYDDPENPQYRFFPYVTGDADCFNTPPPAGLRKEGNKK